MSATCDATPGGGCPCLGCAIRAATAAWLAGKDEEVDSIEMLAALAQLAGWAVAASLERYRAALLAGFVAALEVAAGRSDMAAPTHRPPARVQ